VVTTVEAASFLHMMRRAGVGACCWHPWLVVLLPAAYGAMVTPFCFTGTEQAPADPFCCQAVSLGVSVTQPGGGSGCAIIAASHVLQLICSIT
jgi:hypothetical protein